MGRPTGQHKSRGSPFAPGVSLSKAHALTNLRAQAPSTVPWAATHVYSALWLLFRLRRGRPNPEVASSGSASARTSMLPKLSVGWKGKIARPAPPSDRPTMPKADI